MDIQVCHGTADKYSLVCIAASSFGLTACTIGPVLAFFITRPLALRDTRNISSMPDKIFSDTFKIFLNHCQAHNFIEETKISSLFYFIFKLILAMPLRTVFTLELIALRGGPEWFTEVQSTIVVANLYYCQPLLSKSQVLRPIS